MFLQLKKKKREEVKKVKFLQKFKMFSLVDSLLEVYLFIRQVCFFDNCFYCFLQID